MSTLRRHPASFLQCALTLLMAGVAACAPSGGGSNSGDSGNAPAGGDRLALVEVFPGELTQPMVAINDPNDDTRWFFGRRNGVVEWISTAAPTVVNPVGTVAGVNADGEGGLLSMAFYPGSSTELYVSFTANGIDPNPLLSRILRYDIGSGTLSAPETILELDQPETNHNGGDIKFGPEGMLYIAFGDGGGGGDPDGNGQNRTTLLGDLLRVDVSGGGTGYIVPADNPYVGAGGGVQEEIYASGLRNPWRFSFDRDTGFLWLADVGQGNWEEVNVVGSGDNLGWNVMEGRHCYEPAEDCDTTGLTFPVAEYSSDSGSGDCSITGGYVYRGLLYPEWEGLYFYGDFCSGRIWTKQGVAGPVQFMVNTNLSITSFAEGNDGELYVIDLFAGQMFHMVPAP